MFCTAGSEIVPTTKDNIFWWIGGDGVRHTGCNWGELGEAERRNTMFRWGWLCDAEPARASDNRPSPTANQDIRFQQWRLLDDSEDSGLDT